MSASTRRLLGGLATVAVLLLGQVGSVIAASPTPSAAPPSGPTGNEMLSVQPSLISVSAKPGSTTSVQLTLRAAANLSVAINSMGLAQGTDGNFKPVPAAQDTSAYSARAMIRVSRQSLQVHPGNKIPVTVTIAVPADVGTGTRYAILTITGMPAAPSGTSNVGFGVELGVSAIVQIAGTAQTKTGAISNIVVGQSLPGQGLPVTVSFLDTGNTHYGAIPNELVTSATLQDSSGAQLASASAHGGLTSVIPTFTRDFALSMTPSKPLVDGAQYHIAVGVGLRDGTVLDRRVLDFLWSGGRVLAATGRPGQPQPATPVAPANAALVFVAALVGAAVVAAFFLLVPRLRRRPLPESGASGK